MRRLLATLAIVGALLFSGGATLADDTSKANKLFVEAVKLVNLAENVEALEMKAAVQEEALRKLNEIVDDYPSSDLAVKLISGQRIGVISLEAVGEAAEKARRKVKRVRAAVSDGYTAYNRGDYATAVQEWLTAAGLGNEDAQERLGGMYYIGRGVPQDYAEAAKWYRKAAEQGLVSAQLDLARMYYNGRGVPQDYAEALKWWRAAAHHPEAQFNLAYSYQFGQGVPKDLAEATKRYHFAAEAGFDAAQFLLGQMYHRGKEVPQDYAEAAKLFRMAAEQGFIMAQYRLGYMHALGEGMPVNYVRAYMWWSIAKAQANKDAARDPDIIKAIKETAKNMDIIKEKMSPAQIAKAEDLADEWLPDCDSLVLPIDRWMVIWQSFRQVTSTHAEIAEEEARYTEYLASYYDTCKPT